MKDVQVGSKHICIILARPSLAGVTIICKAMAAVDSANVLLLAIGISLTNHASKHFFF